MDLTWISKLNDVDGAILITKNITPKFSEEVILHKDKLIVHFTVTGYGNTVLEPNVPQVDDELNRILNLVNEGFPKSRIVIRVDPIIPTIKGIRTAYNTILKFMKYGFNRYRISIIDMYPHVRDRFKQANLPLPYGENKFSPTDYQIKYINDMIEELKDVWYIQNSNHDIRIESCAEPKLTKAIQCGCISLYDLNLLGLHDEPYPDTYGYQRKNCQCYSGKIELLEHKHQCNHKCLYCYWR